jgi:hypothetical protein
LARNNRNRNQLASHLVPQQGSHPSRIAQRGPSPNVFDLAILAQRQLDGLVHDVGARFERLVAVRTLALAKAGVMAHVTNEAGHLEPVFDQQRLRFAAFSKNIHGPIATSRRNAPVTRQKV